MIPPWVHALNARGNGVWGILPARHAQQEWEGRLVMHVHQQQESVHSAILDTQSTQLLDHARHALEHLGVMGRQDVKHAVQEWVGACAQLVQLGLGNAPNAMQGPEWTRQLELVHNAIQIQHGALETPHARTALQELVGLLV